MRSLSNVIKLIKLVQDHTGNDNVLLTRSDAEKFGPGNDRSKEFHEVFYSQHTGKFHYRSYSTSYHNGDSYEDYSKELKPTKSLLDAIVEKIEPLAVDIVKEQLKEKEEDRLTRQAELLVKKILRDI
jgi:hypothetical protein